MNRVARSRVANKAERSKAADNKEVKSKVASRAANKADNKEVSKVARSSRGERSNKVVSSPVRKMSKGLSSRWRKPRAS